MPPMKNYEPIPPQLMRQLAVMTHDLHNVREHMTAGRIDPIQFESLERVLSARLSLLEAEVHARMLEEAQGRNRRFKLT